VVEAGVLEELPKELRLAFDQSSIRHSVMEVEQQISVEVVLVRKEAEMEELCSELGKLVRAEEMQWPS